MAQRRGRDSELIPTHLEVDQETHNCGTQDLPYPQRGYLGEDLTDGRPRFCPVCRENTAPGRRVRLNGVLEFAGR